MTGLVRKATLIGVCGLLAAATAFANAPSPGNSDTPAWIPVVGTNNGVPHAGQSITITVRDFTNNPIAAQAVEIDYSGCSDIRVCTAVVAGGGTPSCSVANGKVTATTNAAGQVSLTVLGASNNSGGGAAGAGTPCVVVRAGTTVLNTRSSYVFDQNGTIGGQNGVTGTDLGISQADFLIAVYKNRTDYDLSGTLTGTDLAVHQAAFLGNGSASGCASPGPVFPGYCGP